LEIDASAQGHQLEKLARLKTRRDNSKVQECLDALRNAAKGSDNTMPFILDAVRAYATVGEICDAFREVFGSYTETSVL
jgi:methylmalonyl-CoA mutase N-terminal domain/subunit